MSHAADERITAMGIRVTCKLRSAKKISALVTRLRNSLEALIYAPIEPVFGEPQTIVGLRLSPSCGFRHIVLSWCKENQSCYVRTHLYRAYYACGGIGNVMTAWGNMRTLADLLIDRPEFECDVHMTSLFHLVTDMTREHATDPLRPDHCRYFRWRFNGFPWLSKELQHFPADFRNPPGPVSEIPQPPAPTLTDLLLEPSPAPCTPIRHNRRRIQFGDRSDL